MAPAVTQADRPTAPVAGAPQRPDLRGADPARPPGRGDGGAGRRAGRTAIGVHHVCQRAGISRRTFYDLYVDRDACLVDTLGVAQGRLLGCVAEAVVEVGAEWEDRAVAATQALFGALCADRVLAHLCVVAPLAAGRDALALRRAAIDEIGRLLGEPPRHRAAERRCSPRRWAASGSCCAAS